MSRPCALFLKARTTSKGENPRAPRKTESESDREPDRLLPSTMQHLLLFSLICLLIAYLGVGLEVAEECPSKETRADRLVDQGRALVKHKHAAQARACFKMAVEANPKYVPGLLEAGQGAIVEERYQEAVDMYAAALKIEHSSAALNNMAIAYGQMGSHVDAVATYRCQALRRTERVLVV